MRPAPHRSGHEQGVFGDGCVHGLAYMLRSAYVRVCVRACCNEWSLSSFFDAGQDRQLLQK